MTDPSPIFSYRSGRVASGPVQQTYLPSLSYQRRGNHAANETVPVVLERKPPVGVTAAPEPETDFSQWALAELIQYIIRTHHDFIREELPRLHRLAERSVVRGKWLNPDLIEVWRKLRWLAGHLTFHMSHSESEVFPYIESLERSRNREAQRANPSLWHHQSLIEEMMEGHGPANDVLGQLEAETGGFTPPKGAGPDLIALYHGLKEFADRQISHQQFEGRVLFPRALELEKQILAA